MTVQRRHSIVTVEVFKHRQTDKAWHVSLDGDNDKAVWIPKSQGEIEQTGIETWELQLPEWIAKERGLI
ncbi:hypothetical protein [Paracoccus sp. MKU1]|uniref:hypothetical protein n=1 Tax=Paracoccus sp. MKU1 TaxID=1745182 RepID=UPI00071923B2|nr:hypothetical protein [Paracoccus sp. MKU1]KRW94320.1 hypothetical protein AQY21_20540 [Paracoccus sp. MKU1]